MYEGYSDPDDARRIFMTTVNRKHKLKEHYYTDVGNMSNSMRLLT